MTVYLHGQSQAQLALSLPPQKETTLLQQKMWQKDKCKGYGSSLQLQVVWASLNSRQPSLSEEQQKLIFDQIRELNASEERQLYVTTLVTKIKINLKKVAEGSWRN